jgi:hypothetical protein
MSQRYKGCWIDPRAFELLDGGGWTAEVYVAEDDGPDTIDTQFLVPGVFPTREAAIEAGATAGKRQVDKGIRSHEIHSSIEAETRLPSTYRHGLGHRTDDVAEGVDGSPTKVAAPDNPEDLYK